MDTLDNIQNEKLEQFVQENKEALAALSWGLKEEWGETKDSLGIDLLPRPHFIRCSREALEKLNQRVESKIQEVLGILDGYQPSQEVAIVAIGKGKIKLIHYRVECPPAVSLQQLQGDLDSLIQRLEKRMNELITQYI